MALFLVIEGVTGAMLAFRGPLTEFFDPALCARPPSPLARRLELSELVLHAENIEPRGRFRWFLPMADGVALIHMDPKVDPATGRPYEIGFAYLALDPWTGREIRRLDYGLYSRGFLPNVMPFVYDLHKTLALGDAGVWILSLTALLWTLDCFAGLYLTLPLAVDRFWQRWKPAWLIKWRARWPRVNYDAHRAGSLWLWFMLLLFAWSSVELADKLDVFTKTMDMAFGPADGDSAGPSAPVAAAGSLMGWRRAEARGRALAARIAARDGFALGEANGLWLDNGSYSYRLRTTRTFPHDPDLYFTYDGVSGQLLGETPFGNSNANTFVSFLLADFHMVGGPFDFTLYRWLIVAFGIALTLISTSGVVVWAAKHRAGPPRPRPVPVLAP